MKVEVLAFGLILIFVGILLFLLAMGTLFWLFAYFFIALGLVLLYIGVSPEKGPDRLGEKER